MDTVCRLINKENLIGNGLLIQAIWRVIARIHKDIFIAVNVGQHDRFSYKVGQIQNIGILKCLINFILSDHIIHTHTVDAAPCATLRNRTLNITDHVGFTVILDCRAFLDFTCFWHSL